MPRSSRHKSHKQHKQSSKDGRERREEREYSDSEEIGSYKEKKDRRDKEEVVVRVSRVSGSSEKRKSGSSHGLDEECSGSKRRKERIHAEFSSVDKERKIESSRSDSGVKSKVSLDSKSSKSSRRHESCGEKKEVSLGLVVVSEEVKRSGNSKLERESSLKAVYQSKELKDREHEVGKSSKGQDARHERESSRKEVYQSKELKDREHGVGKSSKGQDARRERESSRKEVYQSKELKDREHGVGKSSKGQDARCERESSRKEVYQSKELKDREHGVGKSSKGQDARCERSVDRGLEKGLVNGEGSRKQSSHFDERTTKTEVRNTESKQQVLRNVESEKELEKRSRKKKDVFDEEKYPETIKDSSGRRVLTKGEKHKDDRYKDKYREDVGRDHRVRDEQSSKDHTSDRSDAKHSRDESKSAIENRRKKSKMQNNGRDGSPHPDDRTTRCKDDYRGKKKLSDNEDPSDRKPRHSKEYHYEMEKKESSGNGDSLADRGRSHSRVADGDSTVIGSQNNGRDDSPRPDDRTTRSKDDYRGKKKLSDNEDPSDRKPRNSKEYHYELEKKVSSGNGDSLADRGRSHSRVADGDSTVGGSKRQSSPSNAVHISKDNFRQGSELVDLKHGDLVSEDRDCANVTSSQVISIVPERASESRSTDKPKPVGTAINKDQSHLAELPSKRSPVLDTQVSPLQLKDKVYSSTGNERRPSNRTPVRCSFDVDKTGHRTYGSKDVRNYSAQEDKVSKDWPMEKLVADESFQADGDTVSVSSSVNKTNYLPVSSSSVHPPPPFKTSADSSSGSVVEDHRGKSSTRYKRFGEPNVRRGFGEPNMGRGLGNAHKGVPNWSTPETNGFLPFQRGPPQGGFHPMMQQFHGPSNFGVRPSIEFNPTRATYHIPDYDRYSGHGRSFGWQNRADNTGPPCLHGWDGINGSLLENSQNKHMMTDRGWEAGTELWKGQNNGSAMDLPTVSWKENNQLRATMDGGTVKPGQRSQNDRSSSASRAESIEIKILDDIPVELVPIEALKQVALEKSSEPFKTFNKHEFCHVYLSKLDISVDLAHPDLYKQCINLLDMARISTNGGESKDLSTEGSDKAGGKITHTSFITPHFPKIKDSILQRAMALYQQRGEKMNTKVPISFFIQAGLHIRPTNEVEKLYPDPAIISQMEVADPFLKEEEELISTSAKVIVEELVPVSSSGKDELNISNQVKLEDSVKISCQETAEEPFSYSDQEKRDYSVPNSCDEVLEPVHSLGSEQPGETVPTINHAEKVDADAIITDLENMELPKNHPRCAMQPVINSSTDMDYHTTAEDLKSRCSVNKHEGVNSFSNDIMCGSLGLTNDSEVYEALAPMSIECKSVNLSWIHSPESTH